MRPFVRHTLQIALALLGLSVLGVIWLLWTPSGARTALGVVSRFTALEIDAGQIGGRLADELRLEGALVRWPGGEADIGRLELRWSPSALVRRHLDVEALLVEDVRVRRHERPERPTTDPAPPDLTVPLPGEGALRWSAGVGALRVEELVVEDNEEESVHLRRLEVRLMWEEGVLSAEGLEVHAPQGSLLGGARIDLVAPEMRLDLQAEPAESAMEEVETVAVSLHLEPAPGHRRMAGPLVAYARSQEREVLRLDADAVWAPERLALSDLRLERPQRDGRVEGRVDLLAEDEWRFRVDIRFSDIDLSAETGRRTDLSGSLALSGTPQRYEGSFTLANAIPGWEGGRVSGPVRGSVEAIEFPALRGEWLQGEMRGRVEADWRRGWMAHGEIFGSGLDPATITPDWPGRINFVVRGSAAGGSERPMRAEVSGELRESVLRGRALQGKIEASFDEEDLEIETLVLRGDGFDIGAQGRLGQRIDFRADIPRLSGLIPDARGTLRAEGWGRWRDGHLAGRLQGEAADVEVAQLRVAQLTLSAEHRSAEAPILVNAQGQGVVYADQRIDQVELRSDGTLDGHRLHLALRGPEMSLRAEARGAYAEERWAAVLDVFEIEGERVGAWGLAEPVDVQISSERFVLAPLRLVGEQGAFLAAEADLGLSPRLGVAQGSWERLDLALLDPLLPDISVAGRSSGSARATWFEQDRLDLQGRLDASGRIARQGDLLEVPQVQAQLAWGVAGLQAQWEVDAAQTGRASGLISSPHSARFGLPPAGRAEARWILSDLGALSPFVPQIELSGESSGDLTAQWHEGRPPQFRAEAHAVAVFGYGDLHLNIEEALVDADWDAQGLRGVWSIDLGEDGRTEGRIVSTETAGAALPQSGEIQMQWDAIRLELVAPLVPQADLSGESSGAMEARWRGGDRLDLQGNLALAARLEHEEATLEVRRAEADLLWDDEGLQANWRIDLDTGGLLSGEIVSEAPGRLRLPEQGRYRLSWEEIELARVRPWLPPEMLFEGSLAGEIEGQWLPQGRLQMTGRTEVRDGELLWEGEAGIVEAPLRQAELSWQWEGESLQGDLSLVLAEYGRAEGDFRIPLPARFPLAFEPAGALRGALQAEMREEGLLNAFLPGLVQESRGLITLDLRAGGTWENPDLRGEARLADAAAYVPAAGVRVEDVQVHLRLEGEEIHLVSLRARSGPGEVEGEGTLVLSDWRPQQYRVQVRGRDFQTIHLPEVQMLTSPDLQIEGTSERLAVRGEIHLPHVLVTGRQTPAPVQPSPDVVVVDAPERLERHTRMELDVRVLIVLGDRVLVDAEGIDARLEGSLRVHMRGLEPEEITANGEIRVAQGRYAAYGLNLTITRGNVLFAGGPVDRPILDILAVRTIGDVRAGVLIGGTPRDPEITLYSDPTMTDLDILAYIVLGHPMGQGTDDPDLLLFAAGALLTRGESVVLQDRIRGRLGLDVLTLEAGDGDVTGSRITIGKYISPDLYISIGQSLFANVQVVRMRYTLTRRLELESTVGQESAVDLYYRIEFR